MDWVGQDGSGRNGNEDASRALKNGLQGLSEAFLLVTEFRSGFGTVPKTVCATARLPQGALQERTRRVSRLGEDVSVKTKVQRIFSVNLGGWA